MDFLLLIGKCISAFLIPFIIYVLFTNSNVRYIEKIRRKDWFYFIKNHYAKKQVLKHQQKSAKKHDQLKDQLETEISFKSIESRNSYTIFGADQNNNSLSINFVLRANKRAETSLALRLQNGLCYTLPGIIKSGNQKSSRFNDDDITGNYNFKLHSISQNNWKVKDLNLELLEPFKRVRITFNGLLQNVSNNNSVEHVQFNFIWNAAGKPLFTPENYNAATLANCIAKEIWRDGTWPNMLKDLNNGYEQFGCLQGVIKIKDSIKNEIILNLPSLRCKYNNFTSPDKEIRIFMAVQDGTLINIVLSSYENGCTKFKYGNIILNQGSVKTVDAIDLKFNGIDKNTAIPNIISTCVKADDREFKCILYLKEKYSVKSVNNDINGYIRYNIAAECNVNSKQARAIVELNYAHMGTNQKVPEILLAPTKMPATENIAFVVNIRSKDALVLETTGGKGNSLALLATIQTKDFIVPKGFVITTYAFKQQLELNQHLIRGINKIKAICCGKTKDKLEIACNDLIDSFQNTKIVDEISKSILSELAKYESTSWAVRSSAIGEDSDELSAAGQNETFLGCQSKEDIFKAVAACWASLYTFQSVQYRWQHGLPVNSEMAVVVQQMVPAEAAGVIFTCHPTTSDPSQMVITSNFGLGESVVSAKCDPDTFVVSKALNGSVKLSSSSIGIKNMSIKMNPNGSGVEHVQHSNLVEKWSINEEQVLRLAKVAVLIENYFGNERDIEWAFYKNDLYLLQSRPVTTLNTWTNFELLHEFDVPTLTEDNVLTLANTGEVMPGAMSVLSQTSLLLGPERGYQLTVSNKIDTYVLKTTPTIQHHVMLNVINGINMKPNKKIQIQSKIVDLAVFGHTIINERINSIALDRFGETGSLVKLQELIKRGYLATQNKKHLNTAIELTRHFNIGIKDGDSLLEIYTKIEKAFDVYVQLGKIHCIISSSSVFYQIIIMSILVGNAEDLNMEHCTDFAQILSSCEDVVSAEVPAYLSEIASIIQKQNCTESFLKIQPENGMEWLKVNCSEAAKVLDTFLEKHGHRLLGEFELLEDSWGEDPSKVIKMLQANCNSTKTMQKKSQSIDDVINAIYSSSNRTKRIVLKFLIRKMRETVGLREKSKSELIRAGNTIRLAYRQLASAMLYHGRIPKRNLIYHLSHYELGQVIQKASPLLINKAIRREKLFKSWQEIKFPEIMHGVPKPIQQSYLSRVGNGVCLNGTPASNGDVTARACVIHNLSEINQLQTGDVLITYSTDIGWSPYFPLLAGVVTELGGLVSHGAVVAREYGLPCIVGVTGATKLFKTGDIVHLQGKTGTIQLVT